MTARCAFVYDLAPQIAAMPVNVDQPVESEIQLCRTGAFYRKDQGHFKVTRTTLDKMLANALERGVDIPIDFHHKGNDPRAPINERDAEGWISPKSLSIRSYKGGYALFGVARWSVEAVTKLKGGKLRYISPEIEWHANRMAASDAGPAGAPIGPLLVAAGLVNDPFFTMNPVLLSRKGAPQRGFKRGAPKRYSMWSQERIDGITKAAKSNGMPAENIANFILALMPILEDAPVVEEPEVVEEVMPANANPAPAGGDAAQSLAAAREGQRALAARLKTLEDANKARDSKEGDALFAQYKSEGRFRIYARAGEDPDGEKKAKEHFAKGLSYFREIFEPVSPLVGQKLPKEKEKLATSTVISDTSMTEGQGLGLHNRVMGELKTRNLSMQTKEGKDEYARLTARYAR